MDKSPDSQDEEHGTRYLDYDRPVDIIRDDQLDDGEKRKLLKDWKMDLDSRLYAEAEGMSNSDPISAGKEASLADLERMVARALEALDEKTQATGRGRT